MEWWFAPSLLGVIAAGILVGLAISLILLKKQGKSFPFSFGQRLQVARIDETEQVNLINDAPASSIEVSTDDNDAPVNLIDALTDDNNATADSIIADDLQPDDAVLEQNNTSQLIPASIDSLDKICLELENNLSIAIQSSSDKPLLFQTEIWNTQRDAYDILSLDQFRQLTDVYVDMRLANDTIWLINELGTESIDLKNNHIKLKNAIAERLQQIMPDIIKTLSENR